MVERKKELSGAIADQLILFAKQLGWLNAPYKLHKDDKFRSRYDRLKEQNPYDPALKLPDIEDCEHLAQWFFESGMGMSGANGMTSLTWQELDSFSRLMGCNLSEWEAKTIMSMSWAYTASFNASQTPEAQAPWVDDSYVAIEQKREAVRNSFRALASGAIDKSANKEPAKKPRKKLKPA